MNVEFSDDFYKSVNFVLKNEGGYVSNKNDSGGTTKYGISIRYLRSLNDEKLRKYGIFSSAKDIKDEDIYNITIDQAYVFYHDEFWTKSKISFIENREVKNYLFDMFVHHGISQAVKILQRSLWAYYSKYKIIEDDGIIGAQTLKLINDISSPNHIQFLRICSSERAGFMRLLISKYSNNQEFLNGWLERCYRITI